MDLSFSPKALALTLLILTACTASPRLLHVAPSTSATGSAHGPPKAVALENRLPGTTAWKLDAQKPGSIMGYAWTTSVAAGSAIAFSVRSPGAFTGAVYRLGWYQGLGGRLVEPLPSYPPQIQPACPIERPRNTVKCAWSQSMTITTGSNWTSGAYLVKLRARDGSEAYMPFAVREQIPRAPVLVQLSVNTWQAYNTWGGASLYVRVGLVAPQATAQRSVAVSFHRPYLWPGAGQLFDFEYALIYWLESRGMNVAYGTDVDLDQGLDALGMRRVFISAGHDEYYSTRMRRALERARDAGVSLAFFGANDVFRKVRFESGDNIEVGYKFAAEDPLIKTVPSETTTSYRNAPLNDPEQTLLGEMTRGCVQRITDWRPSLAPAWLFSDTTFTRASSVRQLFGYEFDSVFSNYPRPPRVQVVATGTTSCGFASSTIYTAGSGAVVFDAGSIWFDCALGPGCDDPWLRMPRDPAVRFHPTIGADARLQRLVANLLDRMLSLPAKPNLPRKPPTRTTL